MMIGLFVIGFFFRLWMANLVPQPFVYDQDEYYGYALGIVKHGLHADLYRLYGYPLIITPLIYFFGVSSPLPWSVLHALLDTMTALLVLWIGTNVFREKASLRQTRMGRLNVPAWIGFLLYLFNPFTAGYTGVLLSEVVTVFLVTLISALLIRYVEKKSTLLLFTLMLLLGFLPQVRPAFFVLSFIAVFLLILTKPFRITITAAILFGIPFWYTIAGNAVYYRQFSLLGVEPTVIREFYASLYIGRGLAFTDKKWGDWPIEAQRAWGAFTGPKDRAGRAEVADRYFRTAIEIIRRDPLGFLASRIAKMGYVWEKHFLYPYVMGKPSALAKFVTYWGNLLLLVLSAIGMVFARRINKRVVILVLGLFLYISLAHIFSTSEERFSLPAYPWVAVSAGYGLWRIQRIAVDKHQRDSDGIHGKNRSVA